MRHLSVVTAISTFALCAAASLRAQAPMGEPPKRTSLQVAGAMTVPVFSYADFTSDIGWKGQASLVVRKNAYYSFRLEGEYNTVGSDLSNDGKFDVYGGGIGGGRVLNHGKVQQEAYLVLGAYEFAGEACVLGTCTDLNELQFGTKVGGNLVAGNGRAKFVLDIQWLYTWSQPYVNMLAFGLGLRF